MILEGQLAAAYDQIEKVENALLEVSTLYDDLVEQNRGLASENERIYEILKKVPFVGWKNPVNEGEIELSLPSGSDLSINSHSTKKNFIESLRRE